MSASRNENSDDIMEIKSEAATSQAAVSYSEDFHDQEPAYYDTPHHSGEENTYHPLDTSQGETRTGQLSPASHSNLSRCFQMSSPATPQL